ncbi:MAG: amidase [Parvularculaceae bacterium]
MPLTRRSLMETGGIAAFLTAAAACSRPDQKAATDLADLDAVETASRIKSGELSAAEAVGAAVERSKRINEKINAIATPTYEAAEAQAASAAGAMGGVPTFVKDLYDVTGVPTGFGSRAFPGYKGGEQVPFVTAFLNLGVVSIGKSTSPEFGLSATTESLATGKTRNPWNLNHSTGGSSGGAGALVASGVVPIAHASDGGGSIRIPASCCGTVGLKVSRGRTPSGERDEGAPISLVSHGVESRTVRDTAAVSAAMALPASESGLHPLDLVTAPGKDRRRIALVTLGLGGREPDASVKEATQKAGEMCASLGHHVEETVFPIPEAFGQDFSLYWASFAAQVVTAWEAATKLPRNPLAFEPFTLGLAAVFEANKAQFADAIARLKTVEGMMAAMHENYDIILSPVLSSPPPEIGWLDGGLDYDTLIGRLVDYVQYTSPTTSPARRRFRCRCRCRRKGCRLGRCSARRSAARTCCSNSLSSLRKRCPGRAGNGGVRIKTLSLVRSLILSRLRSHQSGSRAIAVDRNQSAFYSEQINQVPVGIKCRLKWAA